MDLSKQKKEYLLGMCKTKNIKGYSKLKKEELIEALVNAGIQNVPEVAVTKVKSPKTPSKASSSVSTPEAAESADESSPEIKKVSKLRIEKLSKKLEKSIVCDTYKDRLTKYTEIDDESALIFVKDVSVSFMTSVTCDDYKKYVDTYGVVNALVGLLKESPTTDLTGTSDDIYEALAEFVYKSDTLVYDGAVKKVKKYVETLLKPSKETKEVKADKSKKTIEKPDHDDDQEESSEDDE